MKILSKLRSLFGSRKLDTEMSEEMRLHLELQAERNVAAGMDPDEARYAARRQFGGVEQIKEQCREQRSWGGVDQLAQDGRFAIRTLRRQPGIVVVSVLTLAVGIGFATAVVSAVDSILQRTATLHQADTLAWIYARHERNGDTRARLTAEDVRLLANANGALQSVAAISDWALTWQGASRPKTWSGLRVHQDLASVLHVRPVLGRAFSESDFTENAGGLMMLGYERWRTDLGGDPAVIGRRFEFGDESYVVVGVLPEGLEFPLGLPPQTGSGASFRGGTQDFWITRHVPLDSLVNERAFTAIARLSPDASIREAQRHAEQSGRALGAKFPATHAEWTYALVSLREQVLGDFGRALPVVLGAAGLLLLIASGNVAHLVLARAVSRRKEFAVRVALGGGRGRLMRQVLVEHAFLAVLGGGLAGLVAFWILSLATTVQVSSIPFLSDVEWGSRTLVLCGGLTLLSGFIFSLGPLLLVGRRRPEDTLSHSSITQTAAPATKRWRHALIVAQMALALGLLTGATLLLKSFSRLMRVDLGYDAAHVLAADVAPPADVNAVVWFAAVTERLRALPGVVAVGAVHSVPLTGKWVFQEPLIIEDAGVRTTNEAMASGSFVSEDYFHAIGTPLVAGRTFTDREVASDGDAPAIILNETAARRFFPDGRALGRRVRVPAQRSREVIGIVKDTLDRSLAARVEPQFYLPAIMGGAQLIVRTAQPAEGWAESVRNALLEMDSQVMVNSVHPLRQIVATSVADRQFATLLLTVFASTAFGLVLIGLYGVMEYSVAQRTRELGIRHALGARAAQVQRMIMSEAMRLVSCGLLLGGVAAWMITQGLKPLLFAMEGIEAESYFVAASLLAMAGLLAAWGPARRAAKVDPMVALRCE